MEHNHTLNTSIHNKLVNLAKIVELESYDILRSVNVIINKKLITKND